MPAPESRRELAEALKRLNQEFTDSLPDRIAALENDFAEARRAGYTADALQTFYRGAHNLAGAAGTFGRPVLGAEARLLADCLYRFAERGAAIGTADRQRIEDLTANVIAAASRGG